MKEVPQKIKGVFAKKSVQSLLSVLFFIISAAIFLNVLAQYNVRIIENEAASRFNSCILSVPKSSSARVKYCEKRVENELKVNVKTYEEVEDVNND